MDAFDLFPFVWTGIILFYVGWCFALGVAELRSGSARLWLWDISADAERGEEPTRYWFAVSSKFMGVLVGVAMIWMSFDSLWA